MVGTRVEKAISDFRLADAGAIMFRRHNAPSASRRVAMDLSGIEKPFCDGTNHQAQCINVPCHFSYLFRTTSVRRCWCCEAIEPQLAERNLGVRLRDCPCPSHPLSQQLLFGMRPAATSALRPRNTSQLALSKGEKDKWYKWRHISPARLLRCLVSLKSSCRHRHIPKATVVDPVCAGRQGLMPAADCVVQKRTRVVYALPLFPRLHVE